MLVAKKNACDESINSVSSPIYFLKMFSSYWVYGYECLQLDYMHIHEIDKNRQMCTTL